MTVHYDVRPRGHIYPLCNDPTQDPTNLTTDLDQVTCASCQYLANEIYQKLKDSQWNRVMYR